MNRRNVTLAVVAAAVLGLLAYVYGGHSAPAGQKPLIDLSVSGLQDLRTDFNQSAAQPRMIVLLSPT